MGGIDGYHKPRDSTSNARGKKLRLWAYKHRWQIWGPTQPSFRTPEGCSLSVMFIVKGIKTSEAAPCTYLTELGID